VSRWRKSGAAGDTAFATALYNLGFLYALERRDKQACDHLRESLRVTESALVADPEALVGSLNVLGILVERKLCSGKPKGPEGARPLYHRAVLVSEKTLITNHPLRALSLETYARVLDRTGQSKEGGAPYRILATNIRRRIIQKLEEEDAGITPQTAAKEALPAAAPVEYVKPPVVTSPRIVFKRELEYSGLARLAAQQGTAVFSLVVGEQGKARDVRLLKGVGFGLDEQAYFALRSWKFEPGTKEGKPVAVMATVEANFRLR